MPELERSLEDGILCLSLNVPGKKNALTDTLRSDLRDALAAAQGDERIRAILLSGAGGAFCSGGDISAMTSDPDVARRRMAILHDIARLLIAGRKPAVAAVSGPAFGAGMSLALCCDAVVGDRTAKFCASFGRMGLPPDLALAWTLPRRTSHAIARRLLLSGEVVGADDALRLGLIDGLVETGELRADGLRRAKDLCSGLPAAKGYVKMLLTGDSLDNLLDAEMEAYVAALASSEHMAARRAFLEKSTAKS